MKKIITAVTIALLFSGVSFAQTQPVAKKKCTNGKECCKGKECNKQDKMASKAAVVKPVTVKKAKAA